MTNTNMKESLKMIKLWKDHRKYIAAYDAFISYQSKLNIKGVKFYSNKTKIYSLYFKVINIILLKILITL